MAYFIGLMSGTSLDGVDAVLATSPDDSEDIVGTAFVHRPFADLLRAELLALNFSGADELHRSHLAANALAEIYAGAVRELLGATGLAPDQVTALGAHGQTVRHRPGEFDKQGYTIQLLNGALLAERCGIDVVCDFRSRDVAAGGQGAPLVPAFHAARFGHSGRSVAVLNLGGIANLTLLPSQGDATGFDCGPANVLLDLWCQRHHGPTYDADGTWAASGKVDAALLAILMREPFLQRSPPKSTGRDLFNRQWLDQVLTGFGAIRTEDVMATLAEFTATCAIDALKRYAPGTQDLLVCGGGAFNQLLMRRLQALAGAAVQTRSTSEVGIGPDRVEAMAFAWLAKAFVARRAGNLTRVTGAAGPRVLGALYPACQTVF